MLELFKQLGIAVVIVAYCAFVMWVLARGFLWFSRLPAEQPVFPVRENSRGSLGLLMVALLEMGLLPFFLVGGSWRYMFPLLAVIGVVILERYRTLEVRAFRSLRDHGEMVELWVTRKSKPELGPGHPNPRFELTVRDARGGERVLKVAPATYHAFSEGDLLRVLRDREGRYQERIVRPGAEADVLRPLGVGSSLLA